MSFNLKEKLSSGFVSQFRDPEWTLIYQSETSSVASTAYHASSIDLISSKSAGPKKHGHVNAGSTMTTSFSRSLSLGYIGGFGYPRQQFSNATVFTRWAKKMRGRGRGPTGLRGQVCSDQKVFQAVWNMNMIQYGLDCFPGHCSGTRFSLDVSGHCLSFVDFVSYGQWCSDPVFLMHLALSRILYIPNDFTQCAKFPPFLSFAPSLT